mgnify:CR=1 FL=1
MLNFLKKYPMSILLAIIALNLFSIAGSLRETAKRNQIELLCAVVNSTEKIADEKWPNVVSSRRLKVFKKINKLVGYDLKYGVDAGDVCLRLRQH